MLYSYKPGELSIESADFLISQERNPLILLLLDEYPNAGVPACLEGSSAAVRKETRGPIRKREISQVRLPCHCFCVAHQFALFAL